MGETLTAAVSDAPASTKIAYQWVYKEKSTDTSWKFITGATAKTYKPTADDDGRIIACTVTLGDTVTPTTKNARSNSKTVTDTLTGVVWLQDIINDGNFSSYPSSSFYTQIGYIGGVKAGMQMKYTPEGSTTAQTKTITADDLKNGYFTTTAPGTYVFSLAGAETDPIYIFDWYTVGFYYSGTTSTSSSGSTVSASGRAIMTRTTSSSSSGAMPNTPTLDSATETQRKSLDIIKYSSSVDNVWLVKRGSTTRVTLTVYPSSRSYAHISLNGNTYASFGNTTTSTTGSSSSNVSRSYSTNPDKNGNWIRMPMMWSIIFNNSATSPRTADESHLGLWSALCLISLTGAATILGKTYKRKKTS